MMKVFPDAKYVVLTRHPLAIFSSFASSFFDGNYPVAQEYNPKLRVNAIAPGFFLTDQNRFLLTGKETGELTARGKAIIAHTPMGRFGAPADLIGAALWLKSSESPSGPWRPDVYFGTINYAMADRRFFRAEVVMMR
jgi:hypothetical protein